MFCISSSTDAEVTVIPLDGIPSSVTAAGDGGLVVTFADTRAVRIISAADGSVTNEIDISSVDRPVSAVPVNGEDNGFLVCSAAEDGLSWFICGHRLEAAARSLEEPVHIRSLRDISGLVPDPFGSYVAYSVSQNSVKLFDSAFAVLRPIFPSSDGAEHATALALHPTNGRVAIGQRDGCVKLCQLLRTRETIEIGICNWA